MVKKNQTGLVRAMQCTEDTNVVLESDKEIKKHHGESERCGQDTLVAQWRGRLFLAIILLYGTREGEAKRTRREGEAQRTRREALKKRLIKHGN